MIGTLVGTLHMLKDVVHIVGHECQGSTHNFGSSVYSWDNPSDDPQLRTRSLGIAFYLMVVFPMQPPVELPAIYKAGCA